MSSVSTMADDKIWTEWLTERSQEACDALIRQYLPLVHYHVQRISVGLPRSVSKDDLISHGMLGLLDALEKFNPDRDLKFDTYASFRVRGAILDGLRKEDWLPRSMREKIKKIEAATEKLEQKLGRNVSVEEVAKEVGISENEVSQTMTESLVANLLSMDEKTNDSDREETYTATIIDKQSLSPEEKLLEEAQKEELSQLIANILNEKEQLVIGLFYFEELTLTEIGQILKLSTSRISQIHSKALFRLQQALKKRNA
ncbi:FliA/WhiG family RNA polymerase sigma factor [Halalkalibacterium halodurans]|uniref:RNA polymerase sigma factor n=1 Tax=Halalkalibacterium halodurans (strain ATCC BAA-125 / DSM 18197 / FERM 7344 / JCM 9153 / C-125) TaxID=272558 RepID=Q9KA59_HALH5|nr:FliA/WhiG family RNA polymerase sigma factor [Halalkalibacterium halodurans]MDY7222979.1 FliA/WhiG family RNA polymerase sigma factor [Halalkalibacterium halodurans]MDY7242200.1 FliA/WhiG family RNA polymerase sigma factor [Halalkalibacterium halodurans]MED3646192.1 FliA/WhiG family RNA polymerase sigma factor [Halalkalibacterium halodurans]MED4081572.1 FliA/WhiG family RNA polymerase sigma factor [Halalkalibacterium halodurans]MED4086188.1 FliA/WhiG family RNA polymerase sigma factor [Hala